MQISSLRLRSRAAPTYFVGGLTQGGETGAQVGEQQVGKQLFLQQHANVGICLCTTMPQPSLCHLATVHALGLHDHHLNTNHSEATNYSEATIYSEATNYSEGILHRRLICIWSTSTPPLQATMYLHLALELIHISLCVYLKLRPGCDLEYEFAF